MGFIFAGNLWQWSDSCAIFDGSTLWCPPCSLWTTTSLLHPHISRDQVAPRHPPRSQTHILCHIITTCTNTCEFFIMFYIPVYFQFTRNDISLMATLRLLLYLMFIITFNPHQWLGPLHDQVPNANVFGVGHCWLIPHRRHQPHKSMASVFSWESELELPCSWDAQSAV
ncbi:MFS transporter [Histoplasma ohiense]|nr:MFS transporter [Histoplasma ohiense (nom. inval.)]